MSEIDTNNTVSTEKLVIQRDERVFAEMKEKALNEAQNFYKQITEDQAKDEARRQEMTEQNRLNAEARKRNQENQHYEQTGRLLG